MNDAHVRLLVETLDANLLSVECIRNGHRLQVVHDNVLVHLRNRNCQTVATLETLLFLQIIDSSLGYSANWTELLCTQQKEKAIEHNVRVRLPEILPLTKRIGTCV